MVPRLCQRVRRHLDACPGAMWLYLWVGGAALMALMTWLWDLHWP